MNRHNWRRRNLKNPNNADSALFKSLTKLLSGPIVNYRKALPKRMKKWHYARQKFTSTSGKSFKRDSYNPFEHLLAAYQANQNRAERYSEMDQLEYTPEIFSALDIYADEMTTSSPLQKLLTVHCANEEIKEVLNTLFYSILNIEDNIFQWCRHMCKYGDYFLYLHIDESMGIRHVISLPRHEIERLEGEDPTNPNYVQFQWNNAPNGGLTLENWQVAHFRATGDDKYYPYGTSVLEGARRISRQLQLQEDAMMAYRIVRAPERRVFYVDVGGIPEKEIEQHVQHLISSMKRNTVIDATSGRTDLRYNPWSIDEDIWIPVRGGTTGTKVEALPGGSYTSDIDDVKYLKSKLHTALKIPASYLSMADDSGDKKDTLAQQDIRFARTIQRLQRNVIAELEKMAVIHLHTMGYEGKDLVSFTLSLNTPSRLAELQELEQWKVKFDVASAATEGYFSRRWIANKIFNLSDEELIKNEREMFYDRQLESELQLSSDPTSGMTEGMPPEAVGAESEEKKKKDEEEVLLSKPGKRNDPTDRSKGKVHPPGKNGVNDGRKSAGPRTRHIAAKTHPEVVRATKRQTRQGLHTTFPGSDNLRQAASGIYANETTNYEKELLEEQKLLDDSFEIKSLIESLEKKTGKEG